MAVIVNKINIIYVIMNEIDIAYRVVLMISRVQTDCGIPWRVLAVGRGP